MLTQQEQVYFYRLNEEIEYRKSSRPAKDSLAEFIRQAWRIVEPNDPFVSGWHIDAISEHLEAVYNGEIRNLLINIPPRHMKSLQVNVFFPAWVWQKSPGKSFIHATHSKPLSVRDSVKCRMLIESNWYREFFRIKWRLKDDQNAKDRFDNTEQGFRLSASVGGSVIGEGADYFVTDDPHDPMEILSETQRKSVIEWNDTVVPTRVKDPKTSARITVMQRLHEKDLSGHLIGQGDLVHLCLPAEYEGDKKKTWNGWSDPRKEHGDLLWPARFGTPEVEFLKTKLGSQKAAGQLQQRPAPAEGNIVKREWWKFYRRSELPKMEQIIQSWDLTFKDKQKSDFVAGVVLGRVKADKYVLDLRNERLAFNGQLAAVKSMSQKWPTATEKLVEDAALAQALIATLQREIVGLIAVLPQGSKIARAESVSPQIESGNIWLPHPDECPWTQTIIEQWAVFPNGANDDIVDAMSQGISRLSRKIAVNYIPVSMKVKSKWVK